MRSSLPYQDAAVDQGLHSLGGRLRVRCLGAGASAEAESRFAQDFDALFETYLGGSAVTVMRGEVLY